MLEEGEIRPVQITVGPLKLSVEPVLSGPSIEFTDYETDISWLSGPPFINATIKGAPASHIALQNPAWSRSGDKSIEILGRLGDYAVTISYILLDNPPRLEERISVGNPADSETTFDRLRIGSVISPPKSWWQYWAYWRLELAEGKSDVEHTKGAKLSDLIEDIRRSEDIESSLPARISRPDTIAAILTDEKRFLIISDIQSKLDESTGSIHLDLIDSKPSPIIAAIGIADAEEREASTIYIPGKDGMQRAVSLITEPRV